MEWTEIVFYISILICILIRCAYQRYDNKKQVAKSYISNTEFLLFVLLILFGAILPLFAHRSLPQFNYTVNTNLKILGIILSIMTIIVFWKAHNDLGKQFSPTLEIKKHHSLITTGIYKYVRHPMYFAGLLAFLSQIFLMPNIMGNISMLCALLTLVFLRVPFEEKMMLKEFGDNYKKYMSETCRVIPFLCNV